MIGPEFDRQVFRKPVRPWRALAISLAVVGVLSWPAWKLAEAVLKPASVVPVPVGAFLVEQCGFVLSAVVLFADGSKIHVDLASSPVALDAAMANIRRLPQASRHIIVLSPLSSCPRKM